MGRWSPEASWRAARPEPRRVRQGTLCAAPWAALPPAGSLAQPKITGELSAGEGEGGEGGEWILLVEPLAPHRVPVLHPVFFGVPRFRPLPRHSAWLQLISRSWGDLGSVGQEGLMDFE